MNKLICAALLVLVSFSAQAQSLLDSSLLSLDPTFQSRSRSAVIQYALVVTKEPDTVEFHANRMQEAVKYLNDQNYSWVPRMSAIIATDIGVLNGATENGAVKLVGDTVTCDSASPPVCTTVKGNVPAQQAKASDASITSAVTASWNSLFVH